MCNRYRMNEKQAELAAVFGVVVNPDMTFPPPELFPRSPGVVIRRDDAGLRADVMRWGFPPPAAGRAPVTNVRNLASPFWRSALARPDRRCLVPVSEFCEWEGEKGSKVARWFTVPSAPLFAFAGLWRPTDAGAVFAFLTCEPNPLVGAVHPKAMPVVLHPADYARWLGGALNAAVALAGPFPSQLMAMR